MREIHKECSMPKSCEALRLLQNKVAAGENIIGKRIITLGEVSDKISDDFDDTFGSPVNCYRTHGSDCHFMVYLKAFAETNYLEEDIVEN
jgi:hypothetical protein